MNEDIRDVIRLGKWALFGNARPTTKPRPLLVLLTNRTAKNLIMDNLYKLKHLESRYKSVITGHDLSKKERQECKVLVEEVKQKTQLDTSGGIHLPCQGFSWNDEDCPDLENSLGSLPPTFNYGNKYTKRFV